MNKKITKRKDKPYKKFREQIFINIIMDLNNYWKKMYTYNIYNIYNIYIFLLL